MMTPYLDAARHNCQTGGHESTFFDWRRPDWPDFRCVAGGPLDAPDLLPSGHSWAVVSKDYTPWRVIVAGYANRDGSPRPF